RRHQAKHAEDNLDQVAGDDARGVEGDGQEQRHAPAVVLPVDHEYRDDQQVGEDEADDAAEADPTVPQHGGERDVADGADEAQHGDDRADQRPPDLRQQRVVDQEERLPEAVRYPGTDGTGEQQADHDVAQDRSPLHDEDVADRGEPRRRGQPPPQRALLAHAHVHGRVPFHGPGNAPLGLPAGGVEQSGAQEKPEQQGQYDDHDGAADELRRGELPPDQ